MIPEEMDREIDAMASQLRALRHDLHRHPELGFEEFRTQKLVREALESAGYRPRDCAGTGLVADLALNANDRPTIALRADMDCLPIDEKTDLAYRSVNPGRSHKCGHDGHTAILVGVARLLAKHREKIPANVRLLFQPAEEGVRGGGARVMVAEGALEGVREVYGLHNWPPWPKGEVRVKVGAMLAQVHSFTIEVEGVGGHGSQPQQCRDPILAAAHLVVALQTVVSRGLGYEGGAVLSVCAFNAGSADNVIPGSARLRGTIRTFDRRVRDRVLERLREVLDGVSATFCVKMHLQLVEGYPVVMNDAGCVEAVTRVATALVGADKVKSAELPMAGGEDFAYFALERPSAFFFLGAGRGANTPGCHHPDFDFEDELIPLGMRMFLGIVFDRARA